MLFLYHMVKHVYSNAIPVPGTNPPNVEEKTHIPEAI